MLGEKPHSQLACFSMIDGRRLCDDALGGSTPHVLIYVNVYQTKDRRVPGRGHLWSLVCLSVENIRMEPTSSFTPAVVCTAVSACRHGGSARSLKDPQSYRCSTSDFGCVCVWILVSLCVRVCRLAHSFFLSLLMNKKKMLQPEDPCIYLHL